MFIKRWIVAAGVATIAAVALCPTGSHAQSPSKMKSRLTINHIKSDFDVKQLNSEIWDEAGDVATGHYWSGKAAPATRHFTTRLLWSDTALYVRFEAVRGEPLTVSPEPVLTTKTHGLWDRDVCEIFIAPNRKERNRYFEFEIAPTGEWVDLSIHLLPGKRETDSEYHSGMTSAAFIEDEKVVMAIKIEWKAFGRAPKAGDVWLGNLFRCVGHGPARGYLAWQATKTPKPGFHVPERFGEFEFGK